MDVVNTLERSIAAQLESHGFALEPAASRESDLVVRVPTRDGDRAVVVQVSTPFKTGARTRSEQGMVLDDLPDGPVVMVAEPYISARRGKTLRAREIPYVDAVGNMWLELPGLHIFVEGRAAPPKLARVEPGDRLSRPSSLRIIFTLLTRPALLQATLRDLAEQCGTSVGAAQAATADLVENGHLAGRAGGRRLTRTGLLADRWVSDYGTRLLPKLEQATLRGHPAAWWIEPSHRLPASVASLGGEAACELLGYPLRSVETLLYGEPPWGPVRKAARLTNQGDATVVLRERFWSAEPDDPATAPSLLVYADLGLHDDPRLREMSRQMRRDDADLRGLWSA